ncbi:hypothetical protein G647_03260 [Cladophialophora carrionii CBS 160.54]|uniref:Uncharacterized protein n=1 Tax=Cladophialophora carrionii CBS 160.54 TaxID=1279043 RepID=V9DJJ1_9EURO|nr:uncharacterized protein G647_03260 [Cladophialophora carrionii CBS 160.54]ETI26483.1 hypothetical protein G647_03260 [Cladophialophora carrionii CBS 160.54]
MSKSDHGPSGPADRIPTYEEALASSSSHPVSWPRRTTSNAISIRDERTRRVVEVVTKTIIPSFANHVSNLCNHITIVLVPADSFPASKTVTEQNVVSPPLHSFRTTGNVVTLSGTENRASFWTQQSVVQELDQILRRELSGSSPAAPPKLADEKTQSVPLPPLQVQPAPGAQLPPRPSKQSWLKRTFALPGEDHDPTGETGKWDLGWRSPEPCETNTDQFSRTSQRRDGMKTLQADEVSVQTKLQDVSFRTENEMGLLETTTVKCIWIEIEVGV